VGNTIARLGTPRHVRGRGGFSLVEVMILAVLLLVAIGGLSGAVLSSLKLSRATEESSRADEGVRALAARMQNTDFSEIFWTYNGSTADDPDGPGTAPGNTFDVPGLAPRRDDPDGRVGRIVFPSVDLGGGLEGLAEDVVDPRLGIGEEGRDLNGNGAFHDVLTNDYLLLPVRLIVEWTGAGGNRVYELDLLLVQ